MVIRAVGEDHDAAHAMGYPVVAVRFATIAFGGALCGLGGAYYTLALFDQPRWQEEVTAGYGWIALALILFSTWRPVRVLAGAYLFGAVIAIGLRLQTFNLPYAVTVAAGAVPFILPIIVLTILSANPAIIRRHRPAAIGKIFNPST